MGQSTAFFLRAQVEFTEVPDSRTKALAIIQAELDAARDRLMASLEKRWPELAA